MVNWLLTWGKTLSDWRGRRAILKNLVYWSVCKQFLFLVKRSSNEWTNALFCWTSFSAGGSFSCLEKEGEPWERGCIGGSLGTLRSDNGRSQWKCRWKIDFTFFEFFFAVIPSQPVTWWLELKRGDCVRDQRGIVVYHLAFPVLKSTKNLVISSRRSCAGTAKKCTNSVMQVLSCCLAHKIYCVFWRSRCHKYRQNKDLKNYASGKSFSLALLDVSFAPQSLTSGN